MANIKAPKYVRQILTALQARGYSAYLVGGCVRDMLLGVQPHDWDICTSALPEQVMEIFPGSLPTGLSHGTVTVRLGSRQAEVTTFRSEGGYADHRHPDIVRFVGDLTEDLRRRDFTMNAIALSADGLLADPFGGVEDIRQQRIRCVGEPEERFEEDALRMFRAFRFSARLGFAVDIFTLEGIRQKAPLAAALAVERIRDELLRILLSPSPDMLYTVIELGLLDRFLLNRQADAALLSRLRRLPRRAADRWIGFAVALRRSGCIADAAAFLTALRLDRRCIACCAETAALLETPAPETPLEWKRALSKSGVEPVRCAALCVDAFDSGGHVRALKAVLKSGECFSASHLAVSGSDLVALGLKGRQVGEMLQFLLDYVMEYPDNNRKELLLSLVTGMEE